jgi:hypothetical protein
MKRVIAIVAALMLLNATPVLLGADIPSASEKVPSPSKAPEKSIDPGIQKDPGPSPDPRAAIAPKHNPDPGMAINPEAAPGLRSQTERGQKEPDKQPAMEQKTSESAASNLQGRVLKIEPDFLTVSTSGGGQARLKLDGNTKIQGTPKVGDSVEVEVTSDKHVVSLKLTQ